MARNFCNFNPLTDWLAQSRLDFNRSNFSNPLRNPSRNFSLYNYSTKFIGLIRYYSTKIESTLKKPSKKKWFLSSFKFFQEFFNPGWKVADQTQKFEFLEVFRFFWHQCCQQEWRNSGWKESWAKIPVCTVESKT